MDETQKEAERLGIKRVLIVDDSDENLSAAAQYFSNVLGCEIRVDYSQNGEDAKGLIQSAFEQKNNIGLVITDLEMETDLAGLEVMSQAYRFGSEAMLLTGRQGDGTHHGHGPSTSLCSIYSIKRNLTRNGLKSETGVWDWAFNESLKQLTGTNSLRESLHRYEQYVGFPRSVDAMKLVDIAIYCLVQ